MPSGSPATTASSRPRCGARSDAASGGGGTGGPPATNAAAEAARKPAALPDKGEYLDQFWELTAERKRGVFNFDGYRPSYFLPLHRVSRANSTPYLAGAGAQRAAA